MRDGPSGGPGGSGFGGSDASGGALGGLQRSGSGRPVEILGPHLRITGRLEMGTFRRITDLVNSANRLFRLTGAKVLLRDGLPSSLAVGDLWVSPGEVSVIAELDTQREARPKDIVFVSKTAVPLAVVTSGHTMTGRVFTPPAATLEAFLQSDEPPFLPMTELRVRSLIDRHVEADYAFALVNRRHIIAASPTVEPEQAISTSLLDRLR